MHELLLEHARGTAVLPTTLPLEAACTAAAKAAEALVTGTPAAPGTTTMVPPSAYEVAYALRIRGKQYQRAAGCQFELAERLEAEWRGRIEGRIRPAGESEADGRRRVHAETLLVLEALVDALGAAIGALELVESPTGRFVCERIPNRAARLLFALDEHRQGEPVRLDERGAATASRGVPPCSEVLYDAGIDHKTSFWSVDDRQRRVQESVHDICERLALEATGSRPETCSERAPRQLHTLRQRRALARGRACLLAASPEMAALEALPIPCPLPLNARGDTTAEAAAVLDRLLCIDSEAERSRLRKLFRRFDANVDELLDREEFGVLMRNCFPSRVADADSLCSSMFDSADVDDSGAISFEEFVKHYLEMKQPDVDPRFEEACTMFEFFDADWSGSLDPDELMCLLNQIFPERCDENEERARELFRSMDTDGSGAISFPEFVAYFDTLKNLYDGSLPPEAAAPSPTAEELAAAAAREQAELEAALVTCRCGLRFLPAVIAEHQRSCEAVAPTKKEVHFVEEDATQDMLSSDLATPAEGIRASIEFAENDANTFVPCEWCGRTFFPDRLPIHLRVCKQRKAQEPITGIRPTIVDGRTEIMGRYRSMKSGKWTQSGRIPVAALPAGATKEYSPQKAAAVRTKDAEGERKVREANEKQAAMEREYEEEKARKAADEAKAKEEEEKKKFFIAFDA